jgi:hypothetical protein
MRCGEWRARVAVKAAARVVRVAVKVVGAMSAAVRYLRRG